MAADVAEVVGVDETGLRLTGTDEVILDLLLDGRRIWSFWLLRDSEAARGGGRAIAWPESLVKFLDGHTRLTVVEHLSGRVLLEEERSFGSSPERIAVVSAEGKPLGIDKSGRMAQTFDTRSSEHVAPLLDAIEEVLGALGEAGIEAFPAYGTLLGAVREQHLIGHDSDADLGYVSRHDLPYDVVRESFVLQRRLAAMGYAITRYSGAAFKVDVEEGDGSVRGLDVFGGFVTEGTLYLMGEVGSPFQLDWIYPLGTCTLEGRTLPAPARPEKLLEAMYGPGWRTPDPAYHFETPPSTWRRLNGWFRGTRVYRDAWERRYSTKRDQLPAGAPSGLAAFVAEREGVPAQVVDLGAGRGGDALWWARQGAAVVGYDFVPSASRAVQETAAAEGLDLEMRSLNLLEWRSVLGAGARLAHAVPDDGPRVLTASHLADCTTRFGRDSLWRLASMGLRGGGRLYLDVLSRGEHRLGGRTLSAELVGPELARYGATIVHEERESGDQSRSRGREVTRWVVEFRTPEEDS